MYEATRCNITTINANILQMRAIEIILTHLVDNNSNYYRKHVRLDNNATPPLNNTQDNQQKIYLSKQ